MEWGNLCLGFLSEHSYRISESSSVQQKYREKIKDLRQPRLHFPASVPWKTPLSLASHLFPTAQLTPPAPGPL